MTSESVQKLRDELLRRPPSPEEERALVEYLRLHPEETEAWRTDAALGRCLRRLTDVPVPSHFTAQVLAAVRRDEAASQRVATKPWSAWWIWLRPKLSTAMALMLAVASLAAWQADRVRRQAEDARNLATLKAVADLSPRTLQDFEAIQRFGDGAPVDFDLLAALQ
ncbi:MAG: hypothetical protein JNK85_27155 [Verrucomicrobiales bacterium]|nr:hypothetical protein [Verrucomicrobiales bacterium]